MCSSNFKVTFNHSLASYRPNNFIKVVKKLLQGENDPYLFSGKEILKFLQAAF